MILVHSYSVAFLRATLSLLGVFVVSCLVVASELGIKVPAGFEVTRFAGDDLAHDIFSITTDANGRIAVSGPGYVKILEDHDADGKADSAHLFAKIASGALGMYFDGPDLIYTGDNKLARLRDTNGDRVGDTEEVWAQLGHQEHGTHHIVKGPDGWFYMPSGNDAGVSSKHATTLASPIKDPICGAILRFSPDGKQSEIVADGFRNMCGLDFNSVGHLFTVDSDNERDQHLPWYCPTRLFDVGIGQSHGWLQKGWQQGWNRPGYFFDSVEPLVRIGRGSPTGVLVYRHRAWPERYRDGVFSACWSMGRIYFFPLVPHGSTYKSATESFLEGEGSTGLAIIGMTVDPAGDMYFAVGGRKTQGSVYRIRFTGTPSIQTDKQIKREQSLRSKLGNELYDVLTANQPLANWSRARWAPAARQIGMDQFDRVMLDASHPTTIRVRALEVKVELGNGPSDELVAESKLERDHTFLARIAWAIARTKAADRGGIDRLVEWSGHLNAALRRAACEAICSVEPNNLHRLGGENKLPFDRPALQARWSAHRRNGQGTSPGNSDLRNSGESFEQLATIRQLQIALGDVPKWRAKPELYVGYSAERDSKATEIHETLAKLAADFPFKVEEINLEVGRVFAMAEYENLWLLPKIANRSTEDSTLEHDLHYLIILSRLPGKRSEDVTVKTASALARLHRKLSARGDIPSRNWPLRVSELFEELCKRDDRLAVALIEQEGFGLPEHCLFVSKMAGDDQLSAARKLLEKVNAAGRDWDTDLLSALKVLPVNELRPHLLEKFNEPALRDAVVLILAEFPTEDTRAHLVESLSSVQPNVVRASATALLQLSGQTTSEQIGRALAALRQQTLFPNEKATRQSLTALLAKWSRQTIEVEERKGDDLAVAYRPWFDWFAKTHPEESKRLSSFAGNLDAWNDRFVKLDWSTGDAARGKAVYEKRACHRCHGGSGRLGPDLAGAAKRFSRDDLLAAILDPNREVAPLYQTTEVVTDGGQSYNGLIVYESPDTTMLQTAPDTIVRLTGVRKDAMRKSNVSLMPTGLLNDASDQEIADLHAYLHTLAK